MKYSRPYGSPSREQKGEAMAKAVNEKNLEEWKADPKSRGRARYNAPSFAEHLGAKLEDVEASEVWKAHLATRKPTSKKSSGNGTRRRAGGSSISYTGEIVNMITKFQALLPEEQQEVSGLIDRKYAAAEDRRKEDAAWRALAAVKGDDFVKKLRAESEKINKKGAA